MCISAKLVIIAFATTPAIFTTTQAKDASGNLASQPTV